VHEQQPASDPDSFAISFGRKAARSFLLVERRMEMITIFTRTDSKPLKQRVYVFF